MMQQMFVPKTHAHTETLETLHPLRNDFGASSPSISVVFKLFTLLGTTLELLHLIFRWNFWLCIPLGTTSELRNLLCAPLGTAFVALELTLRSLRNGFCSFGMYSALP
jgi:ABC-type antimicrobial peptide transport system permease subunit